MRKYGYLDNLLSVCNIIFYWYEITTGTILCQKVYSFIFIVEKKLDSSWTPLFTTETVVYRGENTKISQSARAPLSYLNAYFARIFHRY